MTDRAEFRSWVRWLRRHFPGHRPCRVYLSPRSTIPERSHGICYILDDPPRCVIHIADDLNLEQTADTLWEEWAHYLRDHLPPMDGHDSDHDELYGCIRARIQRTWNGEKPGHAEAE